MTIFKKWLSFVLVDNSSFEDLVKKIELAFDKKLSCEDDEGRYIATAICNGFTLKVIDKIDRLSDFLCDENYTLEILINNEDYFSSTFENHIKRILHIYSLKWERVVWAPNKPL